MRVKYVFTWGYFHPPGCGSDLVAANHMAYFRSRGWEVDCVLTRNPNKDHAAEAFRAEYSWLQSLVVADLPNQTWSFGGMLQGYLRMADVPAVRAVLEAPADLFYTNYAFTAPLVGRIPPGCRKVLESHDILSEQFALADRDRPGPQPTAALRRRLTDFSVRTELELYRLFDAVAMINQDEAGLVGRRGVTNAVYVPQWCRTPEGAAPGNPGPHAYDLLFVASGNPINRAGIDWFYRHMYVPHLWRHGVRLAIAGGVCGMLDIADANVTLLGVVKGSLAPLYRSAAVVVAPIFEGTGLSIKTIEALGYGKAMVVAPSAARGLDPRSGALAVVDMKADPGRTADVILDLLAHPQKRQALEQKAARYAQREFGREAFFAGMDRLCRMAGVDGIPVPRAKSA
jgi:glycosyltransferase involved in cell wall biosynthesis